MAVPPCADQQVGRHAERRVGGHARVAVGTAALHRQADLRSRLLGPHPGIGLGHELVNGPRGRLDRAGDPPLLLDIQRARPMGGLLVAVAVGRSQRDEMLRLDQVRRITHLAAEPHDHISRHVGMMGEARQHALEDLVVEPFKRQPAAPLVGDGEDAVDIGEISPPGPVAELVGDIAGRAGRAIHRADHGDVVACADPSVRAQIAAKRPRPVRPGRLGPLRREGIVALEQVGFEIMHVNQRTGRNRLAMQSR